jgi:hypothetical protein
VTRLSLTTPGVYVLDIDADGYVRHSELVEITASTEFTITMTGGPALALVAPPSPVTLPARVRVVQQGPPLISREYDAPAPALTVETGVWRAGLTEIWYVGGPGEPDSRVGQLALPEKGVATFLLPAVPQDVLFLRVVSGGAALHEWDADGADVRLGARSIWRRLGREPVVSEAGTYAVQLRRGERTLRISASGYATAVVAITQDAGNRLTVTLTPEVTALVRFCERGPMRLELGVRRTRDAASGRDFQASSARVLGVCGDDGHDSVINLSASACAVSPVTLILSTTVADPEAVVRGLPAESTLTLVVRRPDGACSQQSVETGAPGSTIDVLVERAAARRSVVEVVDPEGVPVRGVLVRLFEDGMEAGAAVTDGGGRITVLGQREGRGYRLGIEATARYDEMPMPVAVLNGIHKAVLGTLPRERVRCRVVDSEGMPAPSVPVSFCVVGGPATASMTNRDGVAVADVPEGAQVAAVTYGNGRRDPITKRLSNGEALLTIPAAATRLSLFLAVASVHGTLARVRIMDATGRDAWRGDVYVFAGAPLAVELAPGRYVAMIEWEREKREVPFSVIADVPRRLDVR